MSLSGAIVQPKSGTAKSAVILLHGVGADGENLADIARFLRDDFPDTIFFSPNAPHRYDMVPPEYEAGYQWFSLADRDPQKLLEGVQNVRPIVDSFIDKILEEHKLNEENLALLGFSQGTMTSLFVAPRRQKKLAGIVGFSGALIGAEKLAEEAQTKPDICLIHGKMDDVVPFEMMQNAEQSLRQNGFSIISHARPYLTHSIDMEGIEIAKNFLKDRL